MINSFLGFFTKDDMTFLTDCTANPVAVIMSLIIFGVISTQLPLSFSLYVEYFQSKHSTCNSDFEVILNKPDISSK